MNNLYCLNLFCFQQINKNKTKQKQKQKQKQSSKKRKVDCGVSKVWGVEGVKVKIGKVNKKYTILQIPPIFEEWFKNCFDKY